MDKTIPTDVSRYIASFQEPVRSQLQQIREIIASEAAGAVETISYGMPAYRLGKVLVYFAGHKNHIGFYPTGSGIRAFSHEFGAWKWSKGAVQFPVGKPLPEELIRRMVRFRLAEVTGNQ